MRLQSLRQTTFSKTSFLVLLLIVAVIWFMIALGFWWKLVYTNPETVFWDTIGNNLSTPGYSQLTSYKDGDVTGLSASQVQYGQYNTATTKLLTETPDIRQVIEFISTPTSDYVRFAEYTQKGEGSKQLDGIGVWATADRKVSDARSFEQLTVPLNILFPMGFVSPQERAELVDFAKDNVVYNVNTDNVVKEVLDGKPVYTYQVSVQPQSYGKFIELFAKYIGQPDATASLDMNELASIPPIEFEVSIDPLSRRITRVATPDNDASHTAYKGYGITNKAIVLPEDPVSIYELQQMLQGE